MKKITLLAILLSGMAAGAQEFQWVRTPGSTVNFNPDMVGYSSAADASGNVYFTGFAGEPFAYNDMMGNLYLNKYDGNGGLVFSTVIGGKACNHNIVTDSQGNVILSLGYYESIVMDGTSVTATDGMDHFLLAKFSPQGTLLWHRLISTEEEFTWTSEMKGLTTDANDNIYIGYGNFMDSFIDKYSPDGTKLLSIPNEQVSRITSLSIDTEGNIIAAGSCAEFNASFNGVAAPNDLQYNTFVAKYSPQGAFQWVRFVEDITCPVPLVVARTPDEIYFSSYLFGAYDFGGITAGGGGTGFFQDFFVARLNASGTFQWVREVPGAGKATPGKRNSLALDTAGNVYFAGMTGGSIDWGNGVSTDTPLAGNDAFVISYGPSGTPLMARTAGGEGYDSADGITLDNSGNIYLTGMVNGPAAFGSLEIDDDGQFNYIPYLARLSNITMGGKDITAKHVSLYPNPAVGEIFITGLTEKISGEIVNMLGQKVAAFTTDGTTSIRVDGLPKGAYFIRTEGMPAMQFLKD